MPFQASPPLLTAEWPSISGSLIGNAPGDLQSHLQRVCHAMLPEQDILPSRDDEQPDILPFVGPVDKDFSNSGTSWFRTSRRQTDEIGWQKHLEGTHPHACTRGTLDNSIWPDSDEDTYVGASPTQDLGFALYSSDSEEFSVLATSSLLSNARNNHAEDLGGVHFSDGPTASSTCVSHTMTIPSPINSGSFHPSTTLPATSPLSCGEEGILDI